MKSVYLTSLLLLALVAAPRGSSAQPSDTKAAAAADASGRAHFQRGQRLSASGEYAAAYREFAAGYALTARPLFLFNMAEAARASGDLARARENYLEFLRVDPNSELAVTAQARLADLDRAAGGGPSSDDPTGPPAVTTGPGATGSEPLPLLPPSATLPQPTGASFPAERFATDTRGGDSSPVWKKWPFWAVVGVVAGGAAVYAVSRDGGGPCGAGCTQINFR